MRKIYLLIVAIVMGGTVQAQVATYLFADSLGSFMPLANAVQPTKTVHPFDANNGIDEYYVNAIPIGFNFSYLGQTYNQINGNSNGFASFGAPMDNNTNYYTISLPGGPAQTPTTRPLLAPFWADGSTDSIRYQTSGSSPNRIFTLEWTGFKWSYSSSSATLNFQLKLYEGSNKIQFIYNQTATASTGSGAQIGITAQATGTGNYLALTSTSSPYNLTSTSTPPGFNTRPADGQIFTFSPPTSCTGAIQAGSTSASTNSVCAGESILLTNTGYSSGVGNIAYFWQRSTDNGVTWTNIPGGSNPDSVRLSQTVTTRYRLTDTCYTGPTFAVSNVVTVNMTPSSPTVYLPIGSGYEQDFEAWSDGCVAGGSAIPDINWKNEFELGNNSWRRYDQGSLANWSNNFGNYSSGSARSGMYSARLHTYSMPASTTGSLNAYFNMSAAGSANYRLGFAYRNNNSTFTNNNADSLQVFVSTNGGASFTKIGNSLLASPNWSIQEFNFTSTSAQTIIRLTGNGATDFSGDILIDSFYIQRLNNCSGTPQAGNASANVTDVCPDIRFSVYNQGYTSAAGLSGYTYQWQSSPNGTVWTNIPNANNPDSVSVTQTATTFYRLRVSCSFSNQTSNSNPVNVTTSPVTYITVPAGTGYSEDFENWNSNCGNSDQPAPGWYNQHVTGDSSWRRNDQGSTANWRSNSGQPSVATAKSGTYYARLHSYDIEGGRSGSLSLYANLSGGNTYQIGFYYANKMSNFGTSNDSMQVLFSTDNGTTFTKLGNTLITAADWQLVTFNINSSASQAVIRLRGYGDYSTPDISVDSFYITRTNSCTTVTGGSTQSNTGTTCPGVRTTVYASGFTSPQGITGLSYQWEESANGTTWTSIAGATIPDSLVVTPSSNRSYRLRVTCNTSSATSVSSVTSVTISGAPVYAALGTGVSEDFESWASICATNDRPGSGDNWTTSPVTSDSSWRRNDEGATANWTSATFGSYSPAFRSGAYSARFHSSYGSANTRGRLEYYVNAGSAGLVRIGFYHINTNGSDSLTVFASNNGGTSFTRLGVVTTSTAWTLRTFDFQSPSATTVIRLQARADFGSTDIGVDSFYIIPLSLCAGTPTAGTITSPIASPCSGVASKIYATGFTPNTSSGLSYQWEQSTDGGTTYTAVANGNLPDSVTVTQTVNTRFRLKVRCSFSNDSALSNILIRNISAPAVTYAALGTGVSEDFETWVGGCTDFERPSNNWLVRVITGNASWRRNDQGVTQGGWSNLFGAFTPASRSGTYSARFHSYNTTDSASMSYHLNAGTSSNVQIGFYYINTSGNDSVTVLASNDGGASFTRLGVVTTSTAWTRQLFTYSAANATTVIRLRAKGDNGATDIGVDSFTVTSVNSCNGTPASGTATGPAAVCAGNRLVIFNTGYQTNAGVAGISYQWQRSTNGGTSWTSIAGATNPDSVVTTQNIATQYRLQVNCSFSTTGVSNAVSVSISGVPSYVALGTGIVEDFESWSSSVCGTSDRPSAGWNNFPASTDSSWRRNDQGSTASWTSPTFGAYTPVSKSGSFSARLHTSYISSGRVGNMDLYVNSPVSAISIGFYHINTLGGDSLRVLVSTDGGQNFTRLAGYNAASVWTLRSLNFSGATATTIIRLQGVGDFASTDIGIDSFYVSQQIITPVSLSRFSGVRKEGSNQLSWTTVSEQNVARFAVQRSFDGINFENIGYVQSAHAGGNSSQATEYHFADANHSNRNAWYRLQTQDIDGRYSLSSTLLIKGDLITKIQLLKLYPNPATTSVVASIQAPQTQKATLVVLDLQGRALFGKAIVLNNGLQQITIETGHLPAGMYQLKLICADGCETSVQSFMKQ